MKLSRSGHIILFLLGLSLVGIFSLNGEAKRRYRKSKLTRDETEAKADRRPLILTVGEDKIVDLDYKPFTGSKGVKIGNEENVLVSKVQVGDSHQLVFSPLKEGTTTVAVRDENGDIRNLFTVRVTGTNLYRVAAEMRKLLRDIDGIKIKVVGRKVVVDGEVLVPSDYGRMLSVITDSAYAGYVLNLTSISPFAIRLLAKKIEGDIQSFAPNVKTRVVNGRIFLEGSVDDPGQSGRAVNVARLYLPEVRPGELIEKFEGGPVAPIKRLKGTSLVVNFIVINPQPQRKQAKLVRVTVHLVALSKDYNKVFGFKWQPGFTSDPSVTVGSNSAGGTGASGSTFTATISNLIPRLTSAQDAGFARILKTGTIIVRSTQQAQIEETTQIPYTSLGPNGETVSNLQPVGLVVSTTPEIIGKSNDIELHMKVTHDTVVGRATASSQPITAKHRVETRVYVPAQQSAAIAGVFSSDVGTDFNKDDPAQGTFGDGTQPLFNFIRSRAYRKKKSQFVVFVTPEIVENASDGSEDLKKNFRVKLRSRQ